MATKPEAEQKTQDEQDRAAHRTLGKLWDSYVTPRFEGDEEIAQIGREIADMDTVNRIGAQQLAKEAKQREAEQKEAQANAKAKEGQENIMDEDEKGWNFGSMLQSVKGWIPWATGMMGAVRGNQAGGMGNAVFTGGLWAMGGVAIQWAIDKFTGTEAAAKPEGKTTTPDKTPASPKAQADEKKTVLISSKKARTVEPLLEGYELAGGKRYQSESVDSAAAQPHALATAKSANTALNAGTAG